LVLVVILSFYLFTAVVNAFLVLINNAPQYISRGLYELQQWAEALRQQFPPEIQYQVDKWFLDAGVAAGNAIQGIVLRSISFIPSTFSLFLGLAALPIFLFYVLKDSEKLKKGFYSLFSPWIAEHIKNIIIVIESVLGRYIRAQLLLGLIVGYLCFVGLLILEIEFALVLAIFAGFTELIPILGPWIGGATAVIVTLAIVPEKAFWVALLFLLVQILENGLLVPRIQGGYLRIHPAVAIILLVLGAYIAGFWGIVLAVPLTATIVGIYKYFQRNLEATESKPNSE
jgi:predicted PurR-regulated permease PerM